MNNYYRLEELRLQIQTQPVAAVQQQQQQQQQYYPQQQLTPMQMAYQLQMRRYENAGRRLDIIQQHPEFFNAMMEQQRMQDENEKSENEMFMQIMNNPQVLPIEY